MSRSPLISVEAGDMTPQQFKRKGHHNVTFDELGDELRSLAKAVLDAFGPIAVLQGELMLRQQALEDHLGFVYVPKPLASPDDQQNGGADELPTLAPNLPDGEPQPVSVTAQLDNGSGVTSAGGESGLPPHEVSA